MISTNTAKKTYKLNDEDLKDLYFQSYRNPMFKHGPPMHLYAEADIREAVQRKRDAEARKENQNMERKMERCKRKEEEHAARVVKARLTVESFPPLRSIQFRPSGKLALPMELLYRIMKELVNSHEPKGIRGVGLIVQDFISLSRSCKDLFVAADYGLKELAELVEMDSPRPYEAGLFYPQFLVSLPQSLKTEVLKYALLFFGKSAEGTKQGKLFSFSHLILTLQNWSSVSLPCLVLTSQQTVPFQSWKLCELRKPQ
jgi:hypothetical protein